MTERDYSSWLLAAGAIVGVVAAAFGIAGGSSAGEVPGDAVAVVNGASIAEADYRRALAAVAADRRDGRLDDALRRRVLDRLIDEELLVQRGVELRLVERDGQVRNYLSAAVIDLVVMRGDEAAAAASEMELRALYAANRRYFAWPVRARVQQLFFRDEGRARAAQSRLARGESFASVAADADEPPVPLPDQALPEAKLRDYLGPTVTRTIGELEVGQASAPIRSAAGYHVVRVVERSGGVPRPFEDVRDLVRADYKRRAGDGRLREFLAERRAAAEISVAQERL